MRTKKPNPAPVSFRLEPSLIARLKARAKAEDRAMIAIVRRALLDYLGDDK